MCFIKQQKIVPAYCAYTSNKNVLHTRAVGGKSDKFVFAHFLSVFRENTASENSAALASHHWIPLPPQLKGTIINEPKRM